MKSQKVNGLIIALGVLLFAGGLILTALSKGAKVLPYLGIGLGCGLFGHGMGEVLARRARRADPARFRQMDIEKKDERNIVISAGAKARAFDLMTRAHGCGNSAAPAFGACLSVRTRQRRLLPRQTGKRNVKNHPGPAKSRTGMIFTGYL